MGQRVVSGDVHWSWRPGEETANILCGKKREDGYTRLLQDLLTHRRGNMWIIMGEVEVEQEEHRTDMSTAKVCRTKPTREEWGNNML